MGSASSSLPMDRVDCAVSSRPSSPKYEGSPSPDFNDCQEYSLTPTPKGRKHQASLFTEGLDPNSSPFMTPPSAQPPRALDELHLLDDDETVDFDEFDLDGFTQEEVHSYNAMAEPGQRLQDAVSPQKMQGLMQKAGSRLSAPSDIHFKSSQILDQHNMRKDSTVSSTVLSIPKQVALFVRKHPFLEQVMGPFTKSERRKFERDVYDYAEALGLDHEAAKKHVIKARGFCGEEDYDSDNSALGEEIDNSEEILKRLRTMSVPEPEVLPSIEDAETGQAVCGRESKSSPKKSPYFASIKNSKSQKKRKGEPDSRSGPEEKDDSLKGGQRSKRRKHNSSSAEVGASAASNTGGTKTARKAAKEARKALEQSDTQAKGNRRDRIGALEPRTEEEAYKNYLRSNQQDPHEHGPTLDQTKDERARTVKQEMAFVEKLRDDIRYVNEKQIDLYDQGKMNNETQEVKNDLRTLKKGRDATEEAQKRVDKKRKSTTAGSAGDTAHSQRQSSVKESSNKATGKDSKPKKSRKIKEDFQRPMIQ